MMRFVVPCETSYPVLTAVETLPVGSAKVPMLDLLPDLIEAPDASAAAAAIAAARASIEDYARRLDDAGLGSMASTLRRVLERAPRFDRLTSDLRSALTWLLNAQYKTAGRATMTFAPWARDAAADGLLRLVAADSGSWEVGAAGEAVERFAAANTWVYERLIGLLNDAADAVGADSSPATLLAAATASAGTAGDPSFSSGRHCKSLLKIDYKLDGQGSFVIVDINAGLIGAWFDDRLLDLAPALVGPEPRIAPRLVSAILEVFEAERGHPPRRPALCVLDAEMYEQWKEADIAGVLTELDGWLPASEERTTAVPVIDAGALSVLATAVAGDGELPRDVEGVPLAAAPDLVVLYSCRIAGELEPEAVRALHASGVTLVDSRPHSLAAAKELATVAVLGVGLPAGVRLPETIALGTAADGAEASGLVAQGWETATARGWSLLAVKIDKQRRDSGAGDFPTAFLYPVTALGRELADQQVGRVFDDITAAAGTGARLVMTHVAQHGGCDAPTGRRDVELRTYAFPVFT